MVESLTHLFNSVAQKSKGPHTIYLLNALPLIHFLRQDLVPNQSIPLILNWTEWEDVHLKFEKVNRTMESKTGYVDHSNCNYDQCVGHATFLL